MTNMVSGTKSCVVVVVPLDAGLGDEMGPDALEGGGTGVESTTGGDETVIPTGGWLTLMLKGGSLPPIDGALEEGGVGDEPTGVEPRDAFADVCCRRMRFLKVLVYSRVLCPLDDLVAVWERDFVPVLVGLKLLEDVLGRERLAYSRSPINTSVTIRRAKRV